MDELIELIDTFSDDNEYTGKEVKQIMYEVVEYCKNELANKDKMHTFHLRVMELKYKPKPFKK
jgi:nucleoid DNA-binding protein